jgi:hypothetical protein
MAVHASYSRRLMRHRPPAQFTAAARRGLGGAVRLGEPPPPPPPEAAAQHHARAAGAQLSVAGSTLSAAAAALPPEAVGE